MSEEQELKLIVKGVVKKLTYDEEEKFIFQSQDQKEQNRENNFDIIISDGAGSLADQCQVDQEMISDQTELEQECELDEDRTETEHFESETEREVS